MTTELRSDDPRLTWQGSVSLERTDGWVMPWRIPHEEQANAVGFTIGMMRDEAATADGYKSMGRHFHDRVVARLFP